MKKIASGVAFLFTTAVFGQDSTQSSVANPFLISGYAEAYYSYDFDKPANNTRPGFLYNYNRHNEFNLNLVFIKAPYGKNRARANLACGVGTYMKANYAAEPTTLKNVFEANVGYKLSNKKNLWLDIGILDSHIGFESAIGKDNWTLTRSIVAENSPYFESGARLSYTSNNGKLSVAGLLLNGWQRIQRIEVNSLMSYGTQVTYKPFDKVTLNYSTFIGADKADSVRLWRYYHNVYGIFQFSSRMGLIAGFDIGMEEGLPNTNGYNTWYAPVGIRHYTPLEKWAFAFRGEYFSDEKGVIISTGTPNGFKTSGASLGMDFIPQPDVVLRLEGRTFSSTDAIFAQGAGMTASNTALTFSTAISF